MNSYQDELKKVLLTYDTNKIKEFMHKHNKNMPRNNLAFWAGVHKGICNLPNCTNEEKEFSRKWLKKNRVVRLSWNFCFLCDLRQVW